MPSPAYAAPFPGFFSQTELQNVWLLKEGFGNPEAAFGNAAIRETGAG